MKKLTRSYGNATHKLIHQKCSAPTRSLFVYCTVNEQLGQTNRIRALSTITTGGGGLWFRLNTILVSRSWRDGLVALEREEYSTLCPGSGTTFFFFFHSSPPTPHSTATQGVPGRFVDYIQKQVSLRVVYSMLTIDGSAASGYDCCISHCASLESEVSPSYYLLLSSI